MITSGQPGPGTPARADAWPDPVPGQVILLPWHLTDYLADGLNVTPPLGLVIIAGSPGALAKDVGPSPSPRAEPGWRHESVRTRLR